MAKKLMNEAERFLLEHWDDARLLEETMKGVRTKYKEVFQKVVEAVTEGHPELDTNRTCLTQSWTHGFTAFGRTEWPRTRYGTPSGLWVGGLRLEELAAEDSEPPYACIWFPQRTTSLDCDAARIVMNEAAEELLKPEELKGVTTSPDENEVDVLLYLPAPSKGELLGALSGGDDQRFVQLFVSQFDMMARFVPVLDKVFLKKGNP